MTLRSSESRPPGTGRMSVARRVSHGLPAGIDRSAIGRRSPRGLPGLFGPRRGG